MIGATAMASRPRGAIDSGRAAPDRGRMTIPARATAVVLMAASLAGCATPRSSKIALGVGAACTVASIPVGVFAEPGREGLSGSGALAAGLAITGVALVIAGGVGWWRTTDDPLAPDPAPVAASPAAAPAGPPGATPAGDAPPP